MALFTFTNTKPPIEEIWATLQDVVAFDSLPDPLVARTIVFALFASTSNFPSTKDEINKFVSDEIAFSVIEQGFTQSVSSKYGITLLTREPGPLEFTVQMEAPSEELKAPYLILKQMFTAQLDKESSLTFLKSVFSGLPESVADSFIDDGWGSLSVNVYTIQRRFKEFLLGPNFRKYFPYPATAEKIPLVIPDRQDLEARLQTLFLTNYTGNGMDYLPMSYEITLEVPKP